MSLYEETELTEVADAWATVLGERQTTVAALIAGLRLAASLGDDRAMRLGKELSLAACGGGLLEVRRVAAWLRKVQGRKVGPHAGCRVPGATFQAAGRKGRGALWALVNP